MRRVTTIAWEYPLKKPKPRSSEEKPFTFINTVLNTTQTLLKPSPGHNMKTKASINILGKGEICPKCKNTMQRRGHKYLTDKQKKQPFYFSEWDVCVSYPCRNVQHYEKYKVWNSNDMPMYIKSKEEQSNLLDIMRNF